MSKLIQRVISGFSAVWLLQSGAVFAEEPRPAYRLGIFPFVSAAHIEASYGPLAIHLGKVLQRPVELRTRTSFPAYLDALEQGAFDVALVQPFDYVQIAVDDRYQPILRLNQPLRAILVVADQSPIRDVSELRGQAIATPPASAAVSHLAASLLEQAGLPPPKGGLEYTSTHDECLLKALQGRVAACVTAHEAMMLYSTRRGLKFRVLAESIPLPHILFVVRTGVPPVDQDRIKAGLLAWFDGAEGRRLLPVVGVGAGLVPARDSDYDVVRRIRDMNERH
jgi:phosphonate transport system substrate-binding protein